MKSIVIFFLAFSYASVATAYEDPLKVFIDCDDCDMTYLKSNLNDIDYVRDPKQAQIYLLVTDQSTGSGGRNYEMQFIGYQDLKDISFKLNLNTDPTLTHAERRKELFDLIKSGLEPYKAMKADIKREVSSKDNRAKINPWNWWIFDIEGSLDYAKEVQTEEYEIEGEIDIERITEEWRIRTSVDYEYQENHVTRNEDKFISTLNRTNASGSIVKSLGSNFSAGIFASGWSNSVDNIDEGYRLNAALEYNFYPYSDVYFREFTVAYFVGPRYLNYVEETIFSQTQETLFSQSLSVKYQVIKPWGGTELNIEGFHYFHDFSKNRLELEGDLSIRLYKGLFVRVSAEARLIHDQLYLPKGDASLEEILLERRALATDFEFEFNVGLAYTFGALANNVVNTRL